MSATAETSRPTKADLQVALDQAKFEIDGLKAEISSLQEETLTRALNAALLDGKVLEVTAAADEIKAAVEDVTLAALVDAAVIDELGLITESLFAQLTYATQVLGAIVAYRGPSVETQRQTAAVAVNELADVVAEGTRTQGFDAENVAASAITSIFGQDFLTEAVALAGDDAELVRILGNALADNDSDDSGCFGCECGGSH